MSDPQAQPEPFTIVNADGVSVGSNGRATLTVYPGEGARLFARRAVKTVRTPPAAEGVLPQLNQLAGELLANPAMPPAEVAARLQHLAAAVVPPAAQHVEWVVGELDGVRVYSDGVNAILTRKEMMP